MSEVPPHYREQNETIHEIHDTTLPKHRTNKMLHHVALHTSNNNKARDKTTTTHYVTDMTQ